MRIGGGPLTCCWVASRSRRLVGGETGVAELSFRWLIGQGSYKLVDTEDRGRDSIAAARLAGVIKNHAILLLDF